MIYSWQTERRHRPKCLLQRINCTILSRKPFLGEDSNLERHIRLEMRNRIGKLLRRETDDSIPFPNIKFFIGEARNMVIMEQVLVPYCDDLNLYSDPAMVSVLKS